MKRYMLALLCAVFGTVSTAQAVPLDDAAATATSTSPSTSLPVPGAADEERAGTLVEATSIGGGASRIRYLTTLEDGSLAEVSGAVFAPTGTWIGEGPAPTVVFAPGTRGMADHCAASRGPGMRGQFAPLMSSLGINYERPFYKQFTDLGMRLVVTDYVGLGTPGVHSYVNRVEQGHAVLDAARAVSVGEPVGFFGYSQGGGAVAAAAELASEYAPELDLRATFAGAPPADLRALLSGDSLGPVLAYAVVGLSARNPEFAAAVAPYFNGLGRFWLWENSHSCIVDSFILWGAVRPESLTNSDLTMAEFIDSEPEVARVLDAQKLGRVAPRGAILVGTAPDDVQIGHEQALQLAMDYRALGADVTTLAQTGSAFSSRTAGGHVSGFFGQIDQAVAWLYTQLSAPTGTPVVSTTPVTSAPATSVPAISTPAPTASSSTPEPTPLPTTTPSAVR